MSVDPNVGTRVWTVFVKVANNTPQEISYIPLTYKTNTGERPTDEWLVTDGYVGYIDVPTPAYTKYYQKVIRTPVEELTIQSNNVVIQTYSVANVTGPELTQAIENHKNAINAERERRISLGCNVAVTGANTIPIKGTAEDMRNLTNLGQLANFCVLANISTTIPFRDNNNIVHTLTPSQMSELWQKAVTQVSAIYQASWDIKDINPLPLDFDDDDYWPSRDI